MSTVATPPDPQAAVPDWARVQRGALIAAGAGLLLCALGAVVDRERLLHSYLVAFLFVLGLTLGSMAIIMLQHLTGGAWGLVLRRLLESATRTLPLVAVLFLPIAFGLPHIYEWAHAGWAEEYRKEHPAVRFEDLNNPLATITRVDESGRGFDKADYLSPKLFYLRAVVYFVAWLLLAFFLNRWSREQDRTRDPNLPRRFRMLSAPGLAVYFGTLTLAAVDWIMSLQPDWYSTIFGAILGTGQVLSGFAFAIAVLALLADCAPLRGVLLPGHLRDLGNLMLAFVMLWAYMAFSQFLLIWSGNLTEEIPYYLYRGQGGWQWVAAALALFQFALPFVLLLSRDVKTARRRLVGVAVLVLVMRFVDLYWMVMPAFDKGDNIGVHVHWLDLGTLLLLGGAWLAWFLWQLGRAPLLPVGDPFLGDLREVPHYD